MKYINYKSDFVVSCQLDNDIEDFELVFYVSGGGKYNVSRKSGVYANCAEDTMVHNLIHIVFKDHNLGCGILQHELVTYTTNSYTSDGDLTIVNPKIDDIELWEKPTDQSTQAEIEAESNIVYLSAYKKAVEGGFTGTEDDFWKMLANIYKLLNDSGSGFVTNLADDEDITSVNNRLKFADKEVNISGGTFGRKYLRAGTLTQSSFSQMGTRYIIQYIHDLNGATITIPQGCTLVFQGGMLLNGTIVGTNTSIEAPLFPIFYTNVNVQGTWASNGHAEWFGAQPTSTMIVGTDDSIDNTTAIQNALDSDFGVMEFGAGYFYCASTIYLKKLKTLKLAGRGMSRSKDSTKNTFTTVIWTKQDIDLFVFDLNYNDTVDMPLINQDLKALNISGGEFDVSRSFDVNGKYTHDCMKFYLPVGWLNGAKLDVSVVGAIGYVSSTNLTVETAGNGIHFTDKGKLYNSRKGAMYVTDITANVSGFGNGICIDYNSSYGDMTSTMLNLVFSVNCFRHIYAPSRAFNGGSIKGIVQSADFNDSGYGANYYFLDGDFTNALVDIYPFDAARSKYMNILGSNVRLGQRLMSLIGTADILTDASKAIFLSNEQSKVLGVFGNHSLHTIRGLNDYVEFQNYVHTIDNDLLGIERAYPTAVTTAVSVDGTALTRKENADANAWTLINNQLFSPAIEKSSYQGGYLSGVAFIVSGTARASDTSKVLTITETINRNTLNTLLNGIGGYVQVETLSLHLKGKIYSYFTNLIVKVNGAEAYNGSYADAVTDNSLSDIVIPLAGLTYAGAQTDSNGNITSYDPIVIELTFTGFVLAHSLGWDNHFAVFAEGTLGMKPIRNLLTSAGGDLGGSLYYQGKQFIMAGAKTTAERNALTNVATGACIFDSTLKKPIWYAGNGWVDANGTTV